MNSFDVYSAGPDGKPGTEDDIGNWTTTSSRARSGAPPGRNRSHEQRVALSRSERAGRASPDSRVILVSLLALQLHAEAGEIERQPVQSTVLASVGYHPAKRLLEIEFHSGAIYRYLGVPEEIHRRLLAAGVEGTFFRLRHPRQIPLRTRESPRPQEVTRDEIKLVVFILTALLVGALVHHCRTRLPLPVAGHPRPRRTAGQSRPTSSRKSKAAALRRRKQEYRNRHAFPTGGAAPDIRSDATRPTFLRWSRRQTDSRSPPRERSSRPCRRHREQLRRELHAQIDHLIHRRAAQFPAAKAPQMLACSGGSVARGGRDYHGSPRRVATYSHRCPRRSSRLPGPRKAQ